VIIHMIFSTISKLKYMIYNCLKRFAHTLTILKTFRTHSTFFFYYSFSYLIKSSGRDQCSRNHN